MRPLIFFTACMTVVWSLSPNSRAMAGNEVSGSISRTTYMHIWRACDERPPATRSDRAPRP